MSVLKGRLIKPNRLMNYYVSENEITGSFNELIGKIVKLS
jgi:hypothetical protein